MPKILLLLFLCLGFSLSAQEKSDLAVYAVPIEQSTTRADLQKQDYSLVEDGVVNYDNGLWAAVKLIVPEHLAREDNYLFLSYSLLDTVELYVPNHTGGLNRIYQTGQAFKFNSRPYASSDFVFPMTEGVTEYYLRVYSSKPVVLPFQILGTKSLFETLTANDFFFGIYVGIILVMFLYNLVLLFVTRDKSYLYYILYLITLVLAQAALFGYTDRYLMSDWPAINQKYTVLSGAMVAIASVFFMINFLNLRKKKPLYAKLLYAVVVIDLIGISFLALGWDVYAYPVVNFASLYGAVIAIIAALRLARDGYKPANFFLIAWSVFIFSVIIFALKDLDIIPYNPIFRRSMLFGSSVEVVLLSVALADRINELRKEKEFSQARALEMAQENERIIREQNIVLEEKVQMRTMELQEANEELKVTLDNLKETQTQLVDAEKMASLGQLTAGIAHEINNPINFITSNINPLKRDLEDVYEIISALEKADENVPQDVLDLKQLLVDLDYDFLKQEMEELVQGISDGANRTSEIVLGLRNFSRLDEDTVKLASIEEGLESTLVLLRNKTKDMVAVEKDFDPNLAEVECFPGKLNQAFMNILNNALYAVNKKVYQEGEEPRITLKTRVLDGEKFTVHLIDNGIGMSPETKKKLFDPFFTTKDVGEGTGLGMSIVFKIIDKHGGKIEVYSKEGEGTEFVLILPKKQPKEFA